jgi:hypothetical protein
VVWCGVVWCGVVWCGVVWCGVVWCGVVWCGVVVVGVCHVKCMCVAGICVSGQIFAAESRRTHPSEVSNLPSIRVEDRSRILPQIEPQSLTHTPPAEASLPYFHLFSSRSKNWIILSRLSFSR